MSELIAELEAAYEDAGYEVAESSRNRDRIRISILDPEASGEALRDITHDVAGEADVLGLNVTTESADNQDVTTVVSFRYRD